MRNRWPLTLRGTGALALAIGCFVLANELGAIELIYFGFLLIGLLIACVVTLYLGARIASTTRALAPDVVAVGGSTEVHVEVSLRTMLPTADCTWRDTLPPSLAGDAHGALPPVESWLRGGDRRAGARYTVTGLRRGVYAIGPLILRTTDPFGLTRRTYTVSSDTRVTVVPATIELSAMLVPAGDAGGSQHATADQLGQGADNLIARPYVPGDSMRRIHWRATAHRDELMVRQEEQEVTPEATVILDRSSLRWAPSAQQAPGADPGFELALSAAVSTVLRLSHDGFQVELRDSDGSELNEPIPGGAAPEDVSALLTRCATLTSRRDDSLPGLRALFAGAQTGPLILVVGRLSLADAEALVGVPHHSARPVLFSVDPAPGALERSADAGWRVARLETEDQLAMAWADASDRGASHVVV